ncbi:hypothetical protein SAMN05421642_111231 [Rhodococcoides kyotonense]|uniref:Uncharacterized protein n=1 Tax=Rhodococcoides kyotonense TaxID=398843 RepID=A0A239L0K0_9NOCA|nr:hypothetical protein SAMN05421642_111231 [Rhodococcus kyotonensis]
MTMFLMGAVGFVGLAMALLDSGRDLNFNNRQMRAVYRSRWS